MGCVASNRAANAEAAAIAAAEEEMISVKQDARFRLLGLHRQEMVALYKFFHQQQLNEDDELDICIFLTNIKMDVSRFTAQLFNSGENLEEHRFLTFEDVSVLPRYYG